jgi:hypothetical protein
MILPNIESNINDVACRFSDKKVEAYHLVYSDLGKALIIEFGKLEVGTKYNLFSCTTFEELKAEINNQGLYLDDTTAINQTIQEQLLA